jgi:hypothetical protein
MLKAFAINTFNMGGLNSIDLDWKLGKLVDLV